MAKVKETKIDDNKDLKALRAPGTLVRPEGKVMA